MSDEGASSGKVRVDIEGLNRLAGSMHDAGTGTREITADGSAGAVASGFEGSTIGATTAAAAKSAAAALGSVADRYHDLRDHVIGNADSFQAVDDVNRDRIAGVEDRL